MDEPNTALAADPGVVGWFYGPAGCDLVGASGPFPSWHSAADAAESDSRAALSYVLGYDCLLVAWSGVDALMEGSGVALREHLRHRLAMEQCPSLQAGGRLAGTGGRDATSVHLAGTDNRCFLEPTSNRPAMDASLRDWASREYAGARFATVRARTRHVGRPMLAQVHAWATEGRRWDVQESLGQTRPGWVVLNSGEGSVLEKFPESVADMAMRGWVRYDPDARAFEAAVDLNPSVLPRDGYGTHLAGMRNEGWRPYGQPVGSVQVHSMRDYYVLLAAAAGRSSWSQEGSYAPCGYPRELAVTHLVDERRLQALMDRDLARTVECTMVEVRRSS